MNSWQDYTGKHRYAISSIAILLFYIVFQLFLYQTYPHPYDSFRDFTVIKELAFSGTFSYFGSAYTINPPLPYLIRAVPVVLQNEFSLVSQSITVILLFFLGQLTVYDTAKQFLKRRTAFYVFLVSALSWSFILATRFRSYATVLLFGGLIIYAYVRYLDQSTRSSAVFVGITMGLGMLAKSSIAFLIAVITLYHSLRYVTQAWKTKTVRNSLVSHHVLFGVTAVALYTPYLLYLSLNGLQLPWAAQRMSITGEATWLAGYTPPSYAHLYIQLVQMFPILSLLSILAAYLAVLRKPRPQLRSPVTFLLLLLAVGPFLGRAVLATVHFYHLFFLFIPLPLLAVWGLKELTAESAVLQITLQQVIALLLIVSVLQWGIHFPSWGGAPGTYYSDSLDAFLNDVSANDIVLAEDYYVLMHAVSPALVEHSDGFTSSDITQYHTDYYIASTRQNKTGLHYRKEVHLPGNTTGHVYAVDTATFYEEQNLTQRRPIQLINQRGQPLPHATCTVTAEDWLKQYTTNNNGTLLLATPPHVSDPHLTCSRIGYVEYNGPVPTNNTLNMGRLNPFLHYFQHERY